MAKFASKPIKSIRGKQAFEELIILDDDIKLEKVNLDDIRGVWELYEQSLEAKYHSAFKGIITLMELVANLQSLPSSKFKDITPPKQLVKEYEFKYQDLRAYAIKIPNGKLMILGGYKNQQEYDIKKFRSLKEQYLKSL